MWVGFRIERGVGRWLGGQRMGGLDDRRETRIVLPCLLLLRESCVFLRKLIVSFVLVTCRSVMSKLVILIRNINIYIIRPNKIYFNNPPHQYA